MKPESPSTPAKYALPALGGSLWLFYLLGTLFPDAWWGTHYFAYVSPAMATGGLLLALALIVLPLVLDPARLIDAFPQLRGATSWTVALGISGIVALLLWQFPLVDDNYGNAETYHRVLNDPVTNLPAGFWGALFSFEWRPDQGREGAFFLVNAVAYLRGMTILEGYRLVGALCGFGWVLSWLRFGQTFLAPGPVRLLFAIAALGSPILLVFMGHLESYALVFLLLGLWMQQLLRAVHLNNTFALWSLLPLWLLGERFNPLFLLLLPVMGLAFLYHYAGKYAWVAKWQTVRGMATTLLLPLLGLGLIGYFFVLEDHADPRILDDFDTVERLFLPIFSPAPPLDRYNVQSFNHLFDLFNVLVFGAPPLLFGLVALVGGKRKILVSSPVLAIVTLAWALITAMLFMINPLFSLPMDFDLYLIAVPVSLGLLAALLVQFSEDAWIKSLLPIALGLSLLVVPAFTVNVSKQAHWQRLESVGKYVFKTYYLHSGRYILYALNKSELPVEEYLARKAAIIDELRPFALPEFDLKFGELLLDQAIILNRSNSGDLRATRAAFVEAARHIYLESEQVLALTELHFRLGESADAHRNVEELIKRGYPTLDMAYRMGVHTALEAGLYDKAAAHCREYILMVPEDTMIQEVLNRLETNDRVDELRYLFARGN
ncbi:MAG: hypothetical protein AAGN35_21160 [Bacteroidota bacterium]